MHGPDKNQSAVCEYLHSAVFLQKRKDYINEYGGRLCSYFHNLLSKNKKSTKIDMIGKMIINFIFMFCFYELYQPTRM